MLALIREDSRANFASGISPHALASPSRFSPLSLSPSLVLRLADLLRAFDQRESSLRITLPSSRCSGTKSRSSKSCCLSWTGARHDNTGCITTRTRRTRDVAKQHQGDSVDRCLYATRGAATAPTNWLTNAKLRTTSVLFYGVHFVHRALGRGYLLAVGRFVPRNARPKQVAITYLCSTRMIR